MLKDARFEPGPRISHGDLHAICPIGLAADEQVASAIAHLAHRFDGVDEQVENHLLQLHAVALDIR